MKTLLRIVVTCVVLAVSSEAQESPAAPPLPVKPTWSLVYLPALEWTDAEVGQAMELLRQVKPDLVVSMAPCPFAEAIRNLECKPSLLDSAGRVKAGVASGVPPVPLSAYADTSTLHSFGGPDSGNPAVVWLSAESVTKPFNGPGSDEEELRSLARMQIRKQFAERKGEVVFLMDPSLPAPAEETWTLPCREARYEQAVSGVTGFVGIRPGTLRTQLAGAKGITPRTPLVHWIHSGKEGITWETLPIDGGPAIQRSVSSFSTPRGIPGDGIIAWLKAPAAPSEVPLWMDDYINNNRALGCGENSAPFISRRFGWSETNAERDTFDVLQAPDDSAPEVKLEATPLPRGAVRSPGNLFSITVGQLDEKGMYPEDGDDGINVYLDDLHGKKSRLIYFAGLYAAWPSAATWFTDRYVITTGTGTWLDAPLDSDPGLRSIPLTIRMFDLVTGRSYVASGMKRSGESVIPTERIFFPSGDYAHEMRWKTLWKAVEASYSAQPEQPPIAAEDAAAKSKLPAEAGLQWRDLGIWPPPETWQLVPEVERPVHTYPKPKEITTGDPYLTCKQTAEGDLHYTIAISGYQYSDHFAERPPETEAVARANLLTAGKGCLPQVGTIQRMGDRNRYLLLSGIYQKPGAADPANGKWMLLVDLLRYRSWSAHW